MRELVLDGHCGETSDRFTASLDPNGCGLGGAFALPPRIQSRGRLNAAIRWCREQVRERLAKPKSHISVSLKYGDCSFYSSCNATRLTRFADFVTVPVSADFQPPPDRLALCEQQLSPMGCRGAKGNNVGLLDPVMCRWHARTTAPDHHARAQRAMISRFYTLDDLGQLLAGKRLALVGDSITNQLASALICALQGAEVGIQRADVQIQVPSLASRCLGLWQATAEGLRSGGARPCTCPVKEHDSWVDSPCTLLAPISPTRIPGEASVAALNAKRQTYTLTRWRVPPYNWTLVLPYTAASGRVATTEECLVCDGQPATVTAHGSDHGTGDSTPMCAVRDVCAAPRQRLPSTVSLLADADAADVVVLNIGHHYHNASRDRYGANYDSALEATLHELAHFSRGKRGRAAAFRETSWQHFDAGDGDFDQLSSLIQGSSRSGSGADPGEWRGPSACAPAPSTVSRTWKNEALHRIWRQHPRQAAAVPIIPFEARTRPRWEFHGTTRVGAPRRGGRLRVTSDCTHFCYSPRFWELVFHDLYAALSGAEGSRGAAGWLRKRHRTLATRVGMPHMVFETV